tara:strand:- start:2510 stop:3604 length:1095 start_codon:yes stop_codon:yes gene_type:complete
MSSFQQEAFNLPFNVVSDPVLTPYGYHLILIVDSRKSQYAYYSPSLLSSISQKICLQSLDFSSLREASSLFDSSLVSSNSLFFNNAAIEDLYSIIKEKEKAGMRGNKGAYIDWFKSGGKKDVYFVYNNKGYGLGWFLYNLEKTPATRIKPITSKDNLSFLFKSFLLQESVLKLGKQNNINSTPFFKEEFLNHKKNILKNKHSSFLISSLKTVDSLLVKKAYEKGLYRGDYVAPKRVVYKEINKPTKKEIEKAYDLYLSTGSFLEASSVFSAQTKNPVSYTEKNPLIKEAFNLKEGEVSSIIQKNNNTFSFIYIEKFLDEIPYTLNRVYSQIERKLKKNQQDSLKKNLLSSLKLKYNIKKLTPLP